MQPSNKLFLMRSPARGLEGAQQSGNLNQPQGENMYKFENPNIKLNQQKHREGLERAIAAFIKLRIEDEQRKLKTLQNQTKEGK